MAVLVIGLFGLVLWYKLSAKQRVLLLLVVAVAFVMLNCGSTGSGSGVDWNLDESVDLTGIVWRALPNR